MAEINQNEQPLTVSAKIPPLWVFLVVSAIWNFFVYGVIFFLSLALVPYRSYTITAEFVRIIVAIIIGIVFSAAVGLLVFRNRNLRLILLFSILILWLLYVITVALLTLNPFPFFLKILSPLSFICLPLTFIWVAGKDFSVSFKGFALSMLWRLIFISFLMYLIEFIKAII